MNMKFQTIGEHFCGPGGWQRDKKRTGYSRFLISQLT